MTPRSGGQFGRARPENVRREGAESIHLRMLFTEPLPPNTTAYERKVEYGASSTPNRRLGASVNVPGESRHDVVCVERRFEIGAPKVSCRRSVAPRESPRITELDDRTSDQITLDEIERIAI